MKRVKPLPPSEADRLSRQIMNANKADELTEKWEAKMLALYSDGSAEAMNLPTLSFLAMAEYVAGGHMDEGCLANLPLYELSEWERTPEVWKLRRLAQDILRLGGSLRAYTDGLALLRLVEDMG